jgi:hypothetical protein
MVLNGRLVALGLLIGAASLFIVLSIGTNAFGQNASITQESGPVMWGFQLSSELTQPVISDEGEVTYPSGATNFAANSGAKLAVKLVIKNVSNDILKIVDSYPEHDYQMSVLSPNGEVLKTLRDTSAVARRTILSLNPGEVLISYYDLTRMYDLLKSGEYTLIARRKVLRTDGEGFGDLESNTVVLNISDTSVAKKSPSSAIGSGGKSTSSSILARSSNSDEKSFLIPIRPVLERHGFKVAWEASKRAITATSGKITAKIEADKDILLIGKQFVKMTKPAKLVNGQLCAPGQAISQITAMTGAQVAMATSP